MYINKKIQVKWNDMLSNQYSISNGIKQDGCLSATLFSIYLNDLIDVLEPDSGTSGCLMVDYVLMERTALRIVSYKCRGFNASKVPFISELLNMCDILLLQETWLYSSQFCLFTTYFNNYNNVSICGMDEFMLVDHMEDALFYTNHLILRYILYIWVIQRGLVE